MVEGQRRGQAAAARLQSAAAEMLGEAERLPDELIHWKPAPDVWSVLEILCHVEEFIPFWTSQTLQVVGHPDQLWGRDHTDTARLAAVQRAPARRPADVTGGIRDGASRAAEAIQHLSDADLAVEATSKNPRWGLKPASFILDHLVVEHVEKHIGQIRRNVTQFQEQGSAGTSAP